MQRTITKWIGNYINIMAHIAPGYTGGLGFRLFCRPARRRIKPGEKRFLDSSEKFSFSHNGLTIRGYRWGNGPKKVLLLHGWQSHSARWQQMVLALPETDYTVYAFDAPGHGFSGGNFCSAPLYGEIIMRFGKNTGRFHAVAGHSIGAFSTLYVMSHFNQLKADKLVILATPGEVKDFMLYFKERLGLSDKALECVKNHFIKEIGKPYEAFSVSRFAEYLNVPGLIIHDKHDRFAPFGYAEILNEKWTGAEMIATEGLGHNLSSPEVTKTVVNFIGNAKITATKARGHVAPEREFLLSEIIPKNE